MEDCRYNVGDKVMVRPGLIAGEPYTMTSGPRRTLPLWTANDDMTKLSGQILTIKKIRIDQTGYGVEENHWIWTDEMLMLADQRECVCDSLL